MREGVLKVEDFPLLLDWLRKEKYETIAPTVSDGAIIYAPITSVTELPIGKTEVQSAGNYRLKDRNDRAYFGYTVGPHSWKKFFFPPERRLWQAQKLGKKITLTEEPLPTQKLALLGVRSCELHALEIQDKVFMGGDYKDPYYTHRRQSAFLIGVNCGEAGGNCFCVSMNTGPKCKDGYDIVLTELIQNNSHVFLLRSRTAMGENCLSALPLIPIDKTLLQKEEDLLKKTENSMGRTLNTDGIEELLKGNPNHPQWKDVASRCLSCANCTLVCPTCFCSNIEDKTDLTGDHAERWKSWDSCFNIDFTYVHGGSVRHSPLSRFRQWMTHKLATWKDQFGSSGCVGCGRCITWCPVGIDITEETKAIRESAHAH